MELPDGQPPDSAPPPPRGRLRRLFGGRPLSVYVVLLAGVAVLAGLLAIVIWTSQPDGPRSTLTCLPVFLADAEAQIAAGLVGELNVVREEGQPEVGPLAITYILNDESGTCRRLPEGVSAQPELYHLIGFANFYNESFAGEQRVRILYEPQANLPPLLLATATPEPTPTYRPAPTATIMPTATAIPTATATATPMATATIVLPTPTSPATPKPTAPPTVTTSPSFGPTRPPASPSPVSALSVGVATPTPS